MSWIEKSTNEFIITTGDGKDYKLLWDEPQKAIEYNVAEFNFPNLKGTRVERGTAMGRKLTLAIYFTGADHLDEAAAFENSANDKRPWRLQHPYYGLLFVQPVSLNFDNTGDNVTKITIPVIETILDDNPKQQTDPIDTIQVNKVVLDSTAELDVTSKIVPTDINTMASNANNAYNLSVPIIKLPEEFEAYYNAFNQASSAINTATASPVLAMRSMITLLSYPANFNQSVLTRLNLLNQTFQNLRGTVLNALGVSSRQIYQVQSVAVLSAMCTASATPQDNDYMNKGTVLGVIDLIVNSYNGFISDLDSLQSPTGGTPSSYIPSADSITQLTYLVSYTISNLYNIALNSRTERTIIAEKDTNIILLTHRLYGLDKDDNNMLELIANNNWGLNSYLLIPKGTKVIYYV